MTEQIIKGIQNPKENGIDISWIIKDPSNPFNTNSFDIDGAPNMKWYIKYDLSKLPFIKGYMFANLKLVNEANSKYQFQNELKIKLVFGGFQETLSITKIVNCITIFEEHVDIFDLKKLFSPDGSLHLRLIIEPLNDEEMKFLDRSTPTNHQPYLFNNILSDVVFLIDNFNIPAHKVILASASPVFEKMFSLEMKENITNVVEIKDADPDVFKEMLSYIYTGEVKNLETMAFGICKLANKYDIPKLQSICEKYLQEILAVDNVISILELADRHNSGNLKMECINFIKIHFNKIEKTEAFKNIKKNLLLDFISVIMSRNVETS